MDNSDDKPLSDEDKAIWTAYTQEMRLKKTPIIEEENFAELLDETHETKQSKDTIIIEEKISVDAVTLKKINNKKHTPLSSQLDKRTDEKLRKGKIFIENRLDLHGLNQSQAYDKLVQFINRSVVAGHRCVLIITGKGISNSLSNDWLTPSKGVLKEKFPYWMTQSPMKEFVLKFYPAQPKDGGSGAFYIYLRRKEKITGLKPEQ